MMDDQLIFCESKSIAASSGAHVHGTNIVYVPQVYNFKTSAVDDSPNNSGRLYWNVVVEDQDLAAAADSAVVTFYLYNGDTGTNPLIDNSGEAILSKAISVTQVTNYPDGSQVLCMPLPLGQLHTYFDIYVTVATQNLSTGKITSWIGPPIQHS